MPQVGLEVSCIYTFAIQGKNATKIIHRLKEKLKLINKTWEYALEKIKHDFHANKSVTDSKVIEQLIKTAEENLDIIRRQVLVGQMYAEGHLVIEQQPTKKT